MRILVFVVVLMGGLVGCTSVAPKVDIRSVLDGGHSITLADYLDNQRELNEKYLYGTPQDALKAAETLAQLEEDYAKNGQRPIDSDHARMLAYSRLFVINERMRQRPEAELNLEKALFYAKLWRPEVGALSEAKQVDFVRSYVDEFEKGLEVRWKAELK